ncbi:carbamoyltransferase HypF [candidate division KSB1 bacterium]|nr:carbamoyltransferase HypF [candidate division KSB1 bacterium]
MQRLRLKIHIQGAVQGVGFRPYIWRLATQLNLTGWVRNTSIGVFIEAEGEDAALEKFLTLIPVEKPPMSRIYSLKHFYLDPLGYEDFQIDKSSKASEATAWMLPDIATCPDCLAELFDPQNQRYLYPFINCTHCGPRFSIIEALPYDRHNTSMKIFNMCPDCQAEYEAPTNRRFHAQPNACPVCGPNVELWDATGNVKHRDVVAIQQTVQFIREGFIIALKGLGGFHLIVDATSDDAVSRLRQKKAREEKPFAIMAPDLKSIDRYCEFSKQERGLLESPESPIVLLQKKNCVADLSSSIAPNNPMLGIMLPYTPLHHILLRLLESPIVATSGNLADETICIDNSEALSRLGDIADYFLVHNRPIVHHLDDSIVRIMADRPVILRRARGYAPLPVMLNHDVTPCVAVGGHLKNTIAVAKGRHVYISQHIGDLETENSITTLQHTLDDFTAIYKVDSQRVAHDAHPDYASTRYALSRDGEKHAIQHHIAHVYSCLADNELEPPALGVAWDGTGYGEDGTIWGGEFFLLDQQRVRRLAHVRTFPLVGGEQAIKQPFRSAIGLLYEMAPDAFQRYHDMPPFQQLAKAENRTLEKMLEKRINTVRTSSAGRLFDAVASLLDIQHINYYEGQAPMLLEFAAWKDMSGPKIYPCCIDFSPANAAMWSLNWQPMIESILLDIKNNVKASVIAAAFHNTLVHLVLTVAKHSGQKRIVLSGGTFQNKYLVEKTVATLSAAGFDVYRHQQVPPNDGGIALGQIAAINHL